MNRVALRSIWVGAFLFFSACGDDGNVNQLPDAPLTDGSIDTPPPAPGMLRLSPTTTSFGSVVNGTTSATMAITVSNVGEGPTGTISASISGAMGSNFDIATNGCSTLAPAATCTISVTFTPSSAGMKSAALAVTAAPGGSVQATLDGIGILPGALTITPSVNAYGNIVTGATSGVVTYTVQNTGGVTSGTLTTTAGGSTPAEFTKTADTCNNTTLTAGNTCTLMIQFAPTTAGPKSANFTVTASGGPGGSVVAAVSGAGLDPAALFLNPTSQAFGSVVVSTTSAIATFSLVNIGGVPTTAVSQTLQGADAGEYTVVSSNCAGAVLQPNSACTFTVRFAPATTGNKTASVVLSAATGGSRTADLSGIGIAPGQITITPSNHGFGNAVVGTTSGTQDFVVENTGGVTTGALSTGLGGSDAGQFTITANGCNGLALAASATCTITAAFRPTSPGVKAALLLASGSPGGAVQASLSGNAIPAAALSITPSSRDFGSVGVGSLSAFLNFTVRNVGGTQAGDPDITITGLNPNQFSSNDDCNGPLAPLATCTISVRFAPLAIGNFSAIVTATSSPGGAISANVFGQGVNGASLSVNPSNLQFGDTLIGDVSSSLNFIVTNNGGTATGPLTVGKSGSAAGEYNIVSSTCGTLPPAGVCFVTLTFQPTVRGTRNASISVSGSPGGSVAVAVSGNARPRLEIIEVDNDPPVSPFDYETVSIGGRSIIDVIVRNNTDDGECLNFTEDFGIPNQFFIWNVSCGGKGKFVGVVHGKGCAFIPDHDICDVEVAFAPLSEGAKFGQLTMDIGPTQFDTAVQQFIGNGVNGLTITPITTPPGFSSPTSDFGNVAVAATSPDLTFEVRNAFDAVFTGPISTAALQVQRFQITDDGCNGVELGPNDFCFISVNFTPTLLGLDQTVLAVSSTMGGSASVNIKGTGVDPSLLIFNPTPLDFGNVFGGDVVDLAITVSNPAGAQTSGPLTFELVNDTCGAAAAGYGGGACFTILPPVGTDCVDGSTTLTGGQSCTVRVRFDTDGAAQQTGCLFGGCGGAPFFGPKSAQIDFDATPGTNGTFTVNLFANTVSTISIRPTNFDFGDVASEDAPTTTFTVHNDSPNPANISFAFFNGNATGLNIRSSTCGTIAGGAECQYVVAFDPEGTVDLGAEFDVFTSDDNGFAQATIGGTRVMPTSCLQILADNPTAGTGQYFVDIDGQFGNNAIQVDCDMVTDGGGYLAYPISGGTQSDGPSSFDSCNVRGLSIVVPRTQAHAANLYAKYTQALFPFVPGVVGTQAGVNYSNTPNGFGSGANCAMNSTSGSNACTSDWHATDFGPWFVRATPFTEPNGDYVAGCWLDNFDFDFGSGGGFIFNDGNCGSGGSSYVCSDNLKGAPIN